MHAAFGAAFLTLNMTFAPDLRDNSSRSRQLILSPAERPMAAAIEPGRTDDQVGYCKTAHGARVRRVPRHTIRYLGRGKKTQVRTLQRGCHVSETGYLFIAADDGSYEPICSRYDLCRQSSKAAIPKRGLWT